RFFTSLISRRFTSSGRSVISSILFRPIMRWRFQSTDEYRDETLTIGSPKVFQTAPPQPASKARITCSPQFAGGPDASPNGFGERIPAKLTEMSGMGGYRSHGSCDHCQRGAFAISHRIHNFAAAI